MQMPSFYDVLGVAVTCTAEDIRRAYHREARKYHPDKVSNQVDDHFLRVQEAYETLHNEDLRWQYDAKLAHDSLVSKKEETLVVVSLDVLLSDMKRDVSLGDDSDIIYTYRCRCGDFYEVTESELQCNIDIVPCMGCSLYIRVMQESSFS